MPLHPESTQAIDEAVARAQARGRVPALILAIVKDGQVSHLASAGSPRPDVGTQFRIGSITKTMTATLVLRLRDEGVLALDDQLHRHLPGTPIGGLTLRQLLGHASGLQREPDGEWWERAAGQDVSTLLAGVTAEKLAYPPHRSHHYSNLAYGVLGAVLERVTGQSWATLVRTRLLEPIGMPRTTYHPQEPFARGYVVHPWLGTPREEPRHDAKAMAPAGQLWSTVEDLAEWAAFLVEPDDVVLATATMTEMCAPVIISDPVSWGSGHGLGLELWRRGERVFVGHTGSMPGYLAVVAVHRPTRMGVVAFANAYTLHGISLSELSLGLLADVVTREPARPAPWRAAVGMPPPDVAVLCGRWWWMGRELGVSWHEPTKELVVTPLTFANVPPWRFTPDGPDRWRGRAGMNDGEILRVVRDAGGTVVALDVATFVLRREP